LTGAITSPFRPQKPPGARFLALKILLAAHQSAAHVEDLLAAALRQHALPRPERALLLELVQGVKRWEPTLDHHLAHFSRLPIKKLDAPVLVILRLGAYQLLYLDRVPAFAAVDEAGKLARSQRLPRSHVNFINAVLRRLAAGERAPQPDPHHDPAWALSVAAAHPVWLVRRWLRRMGPDDTRRLLEANNLLAPLTIRVNTLKIDPAGLIFRLAQEGVEAMPCRHSPTGLTLARLETSPLSLPSYREGLWLFQDEGAQLAGHLLGVLPGESILEIGAGRGGKTTHLAELLQGQGLVLAVDVHRRRLGHLVDTARRWGAGNIRPVLADATQPLPFLPRSQDAVVLDAPCSALGILRRHPEIKTRLQEEDLAGYPPRQRAMLEAAAPLIKSRGRLLYITCTTEPAENAELMAAFLKDYPEFRPDLAQKSLPFFLHPFITPAGFFVTSPAAHNLDGFFAALLRRD
jgi:16S rRNA (cytosine967-C5)-methyltransferase